MGKSVVSTSPIGRSGEEALSWKGESAGYAAKHIWVRKHFVRPERCEFCQRKEEEVSRLEWANKSGKFLRKRTDWFCLCPSCHRLFDQKTHCRNGHRYDENTSYNIRGHRVCKICSSEAQKRYYYANKTVVKVKKVK